MNDAGISCLIVTWNSSAEIARCLDGVLAQPEVGEVIVIDNASSDETAAIASGYGDEVTLVPNAANVGYAAANNQACRLARGQLILLLNPDCFMDAGCVASLAAVLSADATVGVVAAALRYPDGRPQAFARRFPDLANTWWCLTETGRRLDNRWYDGARLRDRRYGEAFDVGITGQLTVDTAAAACVLLSRPDEADLFDERFPLLYNDTDLYKRLHDRGLRCVVEPTATAAHVYGAGFTKVPHDRYRAEHLRSLFRYADRWWPWPTRIAVRALVFLDLLVCLGFIAIDRQRDSARLGARAAAGALGLPGGARPWMD